MSKPASDDDQQRTRAELAALLQRVAAQLDQYEQPSEASGEGGAHPDILDWGINVRTAQGGDEILVELTVVLDGKKGAVGSDWQFSSAKKGTQTWRLQRGGTL